MSENRLPAFLNTLCREAAIYEKAAGAVVRCLACAHRCVIAPGGRGRCSVRFNDGGKLQAPWGYISGAAADPIEKKPFFHALPGARTLSFGMFGCNFTCDFCQNNDISGFRGRSLSPLETDPETMAAEAASLGLKALVSTYNEPLITAEWAAALFSAAKARGLRTAFVSNGYATPEAAAFLRPVLDFWKADLKSFDPEKYRRVCGAELAAVRAGIETIKAGGFWLEVVTLLIPGFNDSDAEIAAMASYLAGLSRNIPWHLTAFHPDHLRTAAPPTPAATLLRARDIALKKGLRYIYCGNVPGAGGEDTVCPACSAKLVERRGFSVHSRLIGADGNCPCGETIPGIWS
ncbi:MAG: AmmeMemoRadiSam system radical SAM enzyme [Elusimicrobia bacterium CG08_land_8_20_14_0_20_59_10]|nr:MAG: AmmeMemoRadiSam system radical SAM enzyme [Elusimicrobia bacterium CG08_land_8_20_14_0_20_59_10]